jgi:hypothetical protein
VVGPIGVVYVTFEDLPDYTIVPRLKEAGADLTKVRIIANVREEGTGMLRPLDIQNVADKDLLRQAVDRVQAGHMVIDPITSAFGGKLDIYEQPTYAKHLLH